MVTKETKKEVKKEETKKVETMSYVLTMPDGSTIEGSTILRPFKPNEAGKFQNSGYQAKVSNGAYSGNIMIIDSLKQVRL